MCGVCHTVLKCSPFLYAAAQGEFRGATACNGFGGEYEYFVPVVVMHGCS